MLLQKIFQTYATERSAIFLCLRKPSKFSPLEETKLLRPPETLWKDICKETEPTGRNPAWSLNSWMDWLFNLEQIISLLCASVSSSAKWGVRLHGLPGPLELWFKDKNESEFGVHSSEISGGQWLYESLKPKTGLQLLTETSQGWFNFNSGESVVGFYFKNVSPLRKYLIWSWRTWWRNVGLNPLHFSRIEQSSIFFFFLCSR